MMNSESNIYELEQVNKIAKRQRHLRVFSRTNLMRKLVGKLSKAIDVPMNYLGSLKVFSVNILPKAPHKRLLAQSVILSSLLFALSAISPIGDFATTSLSYASDYLESYALPGDVLIADGDGYLLKINPQTGSASRIGMTDYAIHSVESGETLSDIAYRYDLEIETLMWENNLGSVDNIRSGLKLVIPPVNGISYTVATGDNLEKLSSKYKIEVDTIVAQNDLNTDVLAIGQSLFLPGAKPLSRPIVATSSGSRASSANLSGSNDVPVGSKPFLYPTEGSITQGYRAGHYAIDIADVSKPAVWAAGAGTIIKASSGTWGAGYGNHVIVDHGNGLKTLYAHLDHLTVVEGQWVNQGEVIGQMGNTGRVYGATGIHLHWEVIKNGVKQYPGNYY